MRTASLGDVQKLVEMMDEFYSESSFTLNTARATAAFTALVGDERLGHVWIIESNAADVGYIVVTLCHSMTFGGIVAIVDDFFVRRTFRGAGLGKAGLEAVRSYCVSQGFRAIQVETSRDNAIAIAVYRRIGFRET